MATPQAAQAVASIVTAPLVIGVRAVENSPEIVGRIRQELTLARFIGKMAVDQGRRELQRRLDGDHPSRATSTPATTTRAPDDVDAAPEPSADEPDDVPLAADLALDDYDQLPAAQIVAKLASLTPAERAQIGRYEAAHRHRRTVLGKLGQLDA